MDIDEIVETFELLEPGEERYRFLIDLGKDLPGMPDADKTDDHIVRGCLSRVWMTASVHGAPARLALVADSDAFIVRGLIAIVLALFDGHTPAEILATDADAVFARLGLEQHLSMGRRNGLHSMVQRVRLLAAEAAPGV
ncbi:MAG: SufE family protein [Alphaproteobacteria bacterium]|nr:SufE family protein [Alphaproteobacteria bacterium]